MFAVLLRLSVALVALMLSMSSPSHAGAHKLLPTASSTPAPAPTPQNGGLPGVSQSPIPTGPSGFAVVNFDGNGQHFVRVQARIQPNLTAAAFYDPVSDSFQLYGPSSVPGPVFPVGIVFDITTDPRTGAGTKTFTSFQAAQAYLIQNFGNNFYAPLQNPGQFGNQFTLGTATDVLNFCEGPIIPFLFNQLLALNAQYQQSKGR